MKFLPVGLCYPDAVALMESGYGDPMGACAEFVECLISVVTSQPDDSDDAVVLMWALGAGGSWFNVDTTSS